MASPQRVIVTGAAQGIGRAVALRVAARGVHLAVWDVQRNGVEDTAKLCREKGATSRAFTIDVGDADGVVVIPQRLESRVLQLAMEKVAGERNTLRDLQRGDKLADVFARYGIL